MLTLENITVAYDNQPVVSNICLALETGQIGCLLGPSGCGKTSILRAIAGFEPIQQGKISLRGNCVSEAGNMVAPDKRQIAVVFQDFALFPHLSVTQNIAFGLHRQSQQDKKNRVNEMLKLVGLEGKGGYFPHQLSGGQQQRVALARAMATRPDLLLLDEPFSSLDVELREELAKDIRDILTHENATALMVTHDQHEAFAMADRIGVLNGGTLLQWADAYNLYHQPASQFVAEFVGSGVFITAELTASTRLKTDLGEFEFDQKRARPSLSGQFKLLVRPDDIVHDDDSPHQAIVISRIFKGAHILYELEVEGPKKESVFCLAPSHHDHQVGERFGIRLDLAHLVVFDNAHLG